MFFIGVFLAALPTQAKVYNFENESDNAHWHFINGTQTNKWVINTAAGSKDSGTKALYVSSSTSYSYSGTTSTVWAYCDDVLSGTVTISFDWKGTGRSSNYSYDPYDYMYAYLVPVNASQPTAGSTTIPTGAIQIGGRFNGQSSWTTFTSIERTLTGYYRLYFMWRNKGYSDIGSPIAIDNVNVENVKIVKPLSYSSFDVVHKDISQATANIMVKYTRGTTYQRLGYIFEQDTVWNEDATSDSIVFKATNLLPDSAYQLSFIAEDSITINRANYISDTNSEGWSGGVRIIEELRYGDWNVFCFTDSTWSSHSVELTAGVEYTLFLNTQEHWDWDAGEQHGDPSHGKVYLCKSATPSEDDILLGTWDYEHYTITKKFTPAVSGTYYIAVYGSSINPETEEYESSYYYIYNLSVYRDTHNELGYYTETDSFTTEPIQATITLTSNPTQSTIPVSAQYNCGGAPTIERCGVMYCQDNLEAVRPDDWSLFRQCDTFFFATTDTLSGVICNLVPDTYYTLCPFVVIQGKCYFGTNILCKTHTIVPSIALGTPTQTTIPITFSYDWGDALDKGTCAIQYCKEDDITQNTHIILISSDSTNGNITIDGLEPNTQYSFRIFGGYNDFERNETAETIYSYTSNPLYAEPQSGWIVNADTFGNTVWTLSYYPITLIKGETYSLSAYYNEDSNDGSALVGIGYTAPIGTNTPSERKIISYYGYYDNIGSCQITPTETKTYYLFVWSRKDNNQSFPYVRDISLQRIVGERKAYSPCCTIKTLPIAFANPELEVVGQTYIVVNSTYDYGDATLVRNVLEFKQSADASTQADTTLSIIGTQTKINNLLPNTTYYYRHLLETSEGGTQTTDWQEFTTLPITLTTQEADGISNTSALLHGTVDCDQESYTEIGFEWKRSDAPATVKPQRLLVTDRVDENLLFRLEGLSSDRYYDFRTFCSYQGETYYGEWVGLLTSDKEVLVAPTVQTVGATANEQGAEMEGFIVTGTEPILQKGFEVWIKGGTDVKTTVAEGRIIRALIPEPWSYTTYQYKAYAKTASGTTYGETMEITTGYIPRDVQDIAVTPSSNSAEVTWTEIEVADYYILTLFADEAMTETLAVYRVGTDGSISRLRMPSAVKALVTCSIEDLLPDTDYYFAVVAYNGADRKVAEESGTFVTEPDPTGIRPTTDEPSPAVRKILYRGQVLILRGDKVYTPMGQETRR